MRFFARWCVTLALLIGALGNLGCSDSETSSPNPDLQVPDVPPGRGAGGDKGPLSEPPGKR